MDIGMTTEEVAKLFLVRANTIRVAFCRNGHYMGIRPIKLRNRRLRWPRSEVLAAASGSGAAAPRRTARTARAAAAAPPSRSAMDASGDVTPS